MKLHLYIWAVQLERYIGPSPVAKNTMNCFQNNTTAYWNDQGDAGIRNIELYTTEAEGVAHWSERREVVRQQPMEQSPDVGPSSEH